MAEAVKSNNCEEVEVTLGNIISETIRSVPIEGDGFYHKIFFMLEVNFDRTFGIEVEPKWGEGGNLALLNCFSEDRREKIDEFIFDLFRFTDPKDPPHIKPSKKDLEKKFHALFPN